MIIAERMEVSRMQRDVLIETDADTEGFELIAPMVQHNAAEELCRSARDKQAAVLAAYREARPDVEHLVTELSSRAADWRTRLVSDVAVGGSASGAASRMLKCVVGEDTPVKDAVKEATRMQGKIAFAMPVVATIREMLLCMSAAITCGEVAKVGLFDASTS